MERIRTAPAAAAAARPANSSRPGDDRPEGAGEGPGGPIRTAGELADELRRFVEGRPIRSRPVSLGERFWRWCGATPGSPQRASPRSSSR